MFRKEFGIFLESARSGGGKKTENCYDSKKATLEEAKQGFSWSQFCVDIWRLHSLASETAGANNTHHGS